MKKSFQNNVWLQLVMISFKKSLYLVCSYSLIVNNVFKAVLLLQYAYNTLIRENS